MVTGISTGALTAPFAFLGEGYDEQLQEVYTTLDTSSILELGNVFNVFRADAITDVTPLKNTIKKYVTDDMIAEIAAVHRRGRTLLIGTTNLDAGAAIYWNIGRIANTGDPDAAALIRDILLASASIPGVFPPVYIKAQTPDGRTYDEMHVDGGTSAQMFLYPPSMDWESMTRVLNVKGTPSAYLIRNSYLRSDYDPVKPRLGPILGRTIDSLIRTQGVGDAYRIHALAERDGVDVRLTWIPDSAVDVQAEEAFDPNYMKALFDFGYQRAVSGKPWLDVSDALYSGSTENLRFEGMTP
jgi:predicted acylesterase/phospholipase RssA